MHGNFANKQKSDITPLMNNKKCAYIPELLKEIEGMRSATFSDTKRNTTYCTKKSCFK